VRTRAAILEEIGEPLVVTEIELEPPGPHEAIVRTRAVAVCCQYGGAFVRRDVPRFARMLESGLVDARPIVTRRYSLDEVNDAFRAAEAREVLTGVIAFA
jgi:Zn-dependent alcohol dehydrogenase